MDKCSRCGAEVFRRKMDNGVWTSLDANGEEHMDTCSGAWLSTKKQRDAAIKRHQNVQMKNKDSSKVKSSYQITGDTFTCWTELKRYGCQWDVDSKSWITNKLQIVNLIKHDFPGLVVSKK